MDVALAGLADEPAVAFASGVDLAIAEAAHRRHDAQSEAFFFTGQEAVVMGPSNTHASVGRSHKASHYQPGSYKTDQAHTKDRALSVGAVGSFVYAKN